MTFYDVYTQYSWEEIRQQLDETTAEQVFQSLSKSKRNLTDFLHLISPAARPF